MDHRHRQEESPEPSWERRITTESTLEEVMEQYANFLITENCSNITLLANKIQILRILQIEDCSDMEFLANRSSIIRILRRAFQLIVLDIIDKRTA